MNLKLKSGSLRGAAELTRWLSANGIAFAGWDADDWALMFLADELAAVYVYSTPARAEATAKIFGRVVAKMRPTVRAVAYHLVARLGNWAQREALWRSAGCEPVMAQLCSFAPGGAAWKGYQLFLNACARIQEGLEQKRPDALAMHTGIICGTQVSSRASYVVFGRARGLVAECSSFEAARRALILDQLGCQAQGGYSDGIIYEWGVGGWAGAPGAPGTGEWIL